MCKYTSLLRVNEFNLDDLWDLLRRYDGSFDEILFFSQSTHSVKNLSEHIETAKKLKPAITKAKAAGIKAGINVLTTVGFFPENIDPALASMHKVVNDDGKINEGRLCSLDKDNIEYIKELYHIYAAVSPDMIYVDDDISALICYCHDCLEVFEKKYNIFNKLQVTRENLLALMSSDDPDIRFRTRKAWISFASERIGKVYEIIENAVHKTNPSITLGAMTYITGGDGFDTEIRADKLKGNSQSILWRPGGGVYTDYTPTEIINKANRISAQIRYLPDYVTTVHSEIENFPYQSLKKSPSFTAFESFVYLAAGCTSTAFNVCSKEEQIGKEHEFFFEMALEAKEMGKLITDTFGRSALNGAGFWWDRQACIHIDDKKWTVDKPVRFADPIHEVGIPMSYDEENTYVYFLDKTAAMQMSDSDMKKCLSKGVLMDCDALSVCNDRGFGDLTGFSVTGVFSADTMEKETAHSLNMPGCHKRIPRQAFGFCGKTYTIEKTAPSAEYLAENRDLNDRLRGMSSGIFENMLGGRICVEGITPFDWYFNLPRNTHLKNVLRWLSKDMLTYLKSFHRIAVWSRANAAFLANISTEDIKNPEIMMKTDSNVMEAIVTKGSKIVCRQRITAISKDSGYRLFDLPEIPTIGTALLRPVE